MRPPTKPPAILRLLSWLVPGDRRDGWIREWTAEAAGRSLVTLGALVGVGAAWLGGRALEGLVFGVSPRDPVMLAVAPLLLIAVGLVAAWLPARRASSVDPSVVLREE